MSDVGLPRDVEEPEMPESGDESMVASEEIMIITGGFTDGESDEDDGTALEGGERSVDGDEPSAEEDMESASEFTLDELVAEMAGVSAATPDAPVEEAAPVPDHIDPLAAAMSETFAGACPVEVELWTRLPFWILGVVWVLFVGALAFLLWPRSAGGLQDAPLYGLLVFGGAALVVIGLAAGLFIWSRARSRAELSDRPIVSRVVLLRVLGWTAGGVALWVITMVVLSLHYLDVF